MRSPFTAVKKQKVALTALRKRYCLQTYNLFTLRAKLFMLKTIIVLGKNINILYMFLLLDKTYKII